MNLKLPKNYEFFVRFFLINIFIFAILRLFFILGFITQFKDVPVLTIAKSFLIGARFDIFVINYGISVFFLIGSLPFIGVEYSKIIRKIYFILMSVIFSVFYFLQIINIGYFKEYGNHLSFTAVEYLNNFDLIIYMIIKDYPVIIYLSLFITIMFLYYYLFKNFVICIFEKEKAKVSIFKRILLFPIFLALLFLGIRGSISTGIMEWGDAFFSKYNIVNQATLNPIFHFVKNIYITKQDNNISEIKYYENINDAIKKSQEIIVQKNDTLIDPKYPLMRKTKNNLNGEKHYNIVILLMEEFVGEQVGALGSNLGLTPNFDKIAKDGILFDKFYSGGTRTNRGVSCTFTSYLPLLGHSIMIRTDGQQKMTTIGSILLEKGYQTIFLNGGDTTFDNMEGFLRSKGINKIISQSDFNLTDIVNKWGVPDHLVFDKLIQEMDDFHNNGKPFFAYLLTLTNHNPYTLPHSKFGKLHEDKSYNTFQYVDYELGRFFDRVKTRDYFDNTIFIILGDHSKNLHNTLKFDYRKSYTPCLFYAPKILKPKKISKLCGQIDIAPTIFAILNMDIIHNFWGKNMLAPADKNKDFAFISSGSDLAYLKDDYFYCYSIDGEKRLHKYNDFSGTDYKTTNPEIAKQMEEEIFALAQTSFYLLKEKRISK